VVRVTQESSSDRIEAGGGQADGSSLILGLQRLEDIVDDGRPRGKVLAGPPKNLWAILNSPTVLALLAMVTIWIAGLWTAVVMKGGFDEDPHGPAASMRERVAPWSTTNSSQESVPKGEVANTPTRSGRKTLYPTRATSRSRRPPHQAPPWTDLLSPQAIDRLALTDEQQSALRRILVSSAQFRKNSGSSAPGQTGESPKARLEEIEKAILEILDESQRARWSAMRKSGSASG
jgi:hypothetical protein